MASKVTGVPSVYSNACSGADQRNIKASPGEFSAQSASNTKLFPFDDAIMNE